MIDSIEPITIQFQIPAADPLGREKVYGKIRFLTDKIELNWRLSSNVFRESKMRLSTIDLSYSEIEHIELHKKWFRYRSLTLRIGDPSLVNDIPGTEVGKMTLEIDRRSEDQVKRLVNYIDFKHSQLILDEQDKRLSSLMEK